MSRITYARVSDPGNRNDDGSTLYAYSVNSTEILPGDKFGYKIVAKFWPSNSPTSWCAFTGPTTWSDDHVISNGNEVAFEVAKAIFPMFGAMTENGDLTYGNF